MCSSKLKFTLSMALKRENRCGIKENTHVERKSDAPSDSGEGDFLSAVDLIGATRVSAQQNQRCTWLTQLHYDA
jgi:hypothetical protein